MNGKGKCRNDHKKKEIKKDKSQAFFEQAAQPFQPSCFSLFTDIKLFLTNSIAF
jgi:hypothetical protein